MLTFPFVMETIQWLLYALTIVLAVLWRRNPDNKKYEPTLAIVASLSAAALLAKPNSVAPLVAAVVSLGAATYVFAAANRRLRARLQELERSMALTLDTLKEADLQRERLEESLRASLEATQKLEKALAQDRSTGLAVENITHTVEVYESNTQFDEWGTGAHIRKWIGIRPKQSFTDLNIPYAFQVACDGGKACQPTAKELPASDCAIDFVGTTLKLTDISVEGTIQINGPLDPTSSLGFQITQPFERAHCVTRKQALKNYEQDECKLEYVSAFVAVPIHTLKFTVEFPDSHKNLEPRPTALVFVGVTETPHLAESTRLRNAVTYSKNVASLTITDPKVGFTYALAWMPPDRELVSADSRPSPLSPTTTGQDTKPAVDRTAKKKDRSRVNAEDTRGSR